MLSDVRIGSQRPRFELHPPDVVSSAGDDAIELAASAGLVLDDWQQWVLRGALGERRDGSWSAFECGLIVPRQNGKNAILEALELAGIFLFGEKMIVHSAHRFDTSTEHFLRMRELIGGGDDLARKVLGGERGFVTANGKEAIKFVGGARLKFIARARGGARGFTGDRIVLDEAYDLPPKIIGNMIPTLSTRPNCQVWYTSSAPHVSSKVLHALRRRALGDDPGRLFFAEWSTDADADPDDRDNWYASNPALGIRISEEYVSDELRSMRDMPEEFARERLGIPDGADGEAGIVPVALWNELVAPYEMVGAGALALDIAIDGRWSSIAAAQVDAEGVVHLDIADRRQGTDWVVERTVELAHRFGLPVQVATTGPATAHVAALERAGVTVVAVTAGEVQRAAESFVDAVKNRRVRHLGNVSMVNAIVGAARKVSGDLWSIGRTSSTADVTPLIASTLALNAVLVGSRSYAF